MVPHNNIFKAEQKSSPVFKVLIYCEVKHSDKPRIYLIFLKITGCAPILERSPLFWCG